LPPTKTYTPTTSPTKTPTRGVTLTATPTKAFTPSASPTKVFTPSATPTKAITQTATLSATPTRGVTPTVTPTNALTQTATPTPTPTATPTNANPSPTADGTIWKAGFETGDLSEIKAVGNFQNQGSGTYSMVSPLAHSGKYSVGLTIDTTAPSDTGSHAAYLFHYGGLPENAYYYSAWFYIPSTAKPGEWWVIYQWKSTSGGNQSEPMYVLDIGQTNGKLYLYLAYAPNKPEISQYYEQLSVAVPTDKWFRVTGYYLKSMNNTGQVIIWQDNQELFNVKNATTVLSDNTVHWSVNNYAKAINPNPLTIYVDDLAISKTLLPWDK